MKEIHSLKGSAEKAVKIFFAEIPFGKHFIQKEYDPEDKTRYNNEHWHFLETDS